MQVCFQKFLASLDLHLLMLGVQVLLRFCVLPMHTGASLLKLIGNCSMYVFQMPKYSKAGYFGPDPHPYHRHWQFKYKENDTGFEDVLDNSDLETCPVRNRVKIVGGSVRLYISENASSVKVDLHLPVEVTMIVIQKFGHSGEAFCYAYLGGGTKCSVKPGASLAKNPHAKRMS